MTLEELMGHMELDKKLLTQRCKDTDLKEIASILTKCDNCSDISLLKLSKANFDQKRKHDVLLDSLQAWKRRYGFKATYKCLVEELLSCGNAEIAEDVCSLVNSKFFNFFYGFVTMMKIYKLPRIV